MVKQRMEFFVPEIRAASGYSRSFHPPRSHDSPCKSIFAIIGEGDPAHRDVENETIAKNLTLLALQDTRFGEAIKIAAANVIAQNALSDPYFRYDIYKTRVDEWLSALHCLAQEVFDANAHLAVGGRSALRGTRRGRLGLGLPGRKYLSGQIDIGDGREVSE